MALSRHVSSEKLQYHGGEEKADYEYSSSGTAVTGQSEYLVLSLEKTDCEPCEPSINKSSRSFRGNSARLKDTETSAKNRNCVVPSPVVAILEVTSIPRRPKNRTAPSKQVRRLKNNDDMRVLRQLFLSGTKERGPVKYTSRNNSFDILMGPPEYVECEKMERHGDAMLTSTRTRIPKGGRPPIRRPARSNSAGENCAEDHPLLPTREILPGPDTSLLETSSASKTDGSFQSTSSIGSKLSSGLSAMLRSAAETSVFNKLAPPSVLFRDLAITDDSTAVPASETTPSVPRCTLQETILATEIQRYEETPRCLDKGPKCMLSIQMQTYPYLAASRTARRENNTFLRVAVLEQNMRRKGKLRSNTVGRARASLPPRESRESMVMASSSEGGKQGTEKGNSAGRTIPRRWVGVSVDEL